MNRISKALLGLADTEDAVEAMEKEIELYRLEKMKPIYSTRDMFIEKIPSFWKIVLSQHSNFANYIRASDFKYVDCIDKVTVDWDTDGNYSIIIKFNGIEDDFPSQTVIKPFKLVKIENDLKGEEKSNDEDESGEEEELDEIEKLVSEPVDIIWPKSYDNINPAKIKDKKSAEGKKNYRTGMKTIFGWFKWTGLKPGKEFPDGDSLAELFAEDLYPYCVKYYTEAQRDLADEMSDDGEAGDSAEEPLDISNSESDEEEEDKKEESDVENGGDVKRQRVN